MNPGSFFGANPGQPAAFGMPPIFPQMAPERAQRWLRIGPIFPALKEGFIPANIPVNTLEKLLAEVKEEGNACFKDKDYNGAYEMYTCALHICKNLQTVHFMTVNRELLSTIFSNRAACLLKMDFFKESIQDCEIAVQQNTENIKAHYRMAVGYKSLRDYSAALDAARRGKQQAEDSKKSKEVKEFEDLIREVESHLPRSEVSSSSGSTVRVGGNSRVTPPKEKSPPRGMSKGSQQKLAQEKNNNSDASKPKSKLPVERKKTESKTAPTVIEKNVPVKETSTNTKKKAEKISKKKVKKKVIPKKSAYAGKFAMLSKEEDASDSDDSDDSDSSEESPDSDAETETRMSEEFPSLDLDSNLAMGLDDFEEYHAPGSFKKNGGLLKDPGGMARNPEVSMEKTFHPKATANTVSNQRPGVVAAATSPLNQTKPPVNVLPPLYPSRTDYSSYTLQFYQPGSGQVLRPSPPTDYSVWASQNQQFAGNQAAQMVPSLMNLTPQPTKSVLDKPFMKTIQNSTLGDFICIHIKAANDFPFDGQYEITLVCDQCYVQTAIGEAGYQCHGKLSHNCDHNVFLIRHKNNPQWGWKRIRPRNTTHTFLGPFRVCIHYTSAQPCRVSERDCSFAHSNEEARLWTLDREQQFDIPAFIMELQTIVRKNLQPAFNTAQPHPGMTFTNSAYNTSTREFNFLHHQNDTVEYSGMSPSGNHNQRSDYGFGESVSTGYDGASSSGPKVMQQSKPTSEPMSWADASAPKEPVNKNHQQFYQQPISWAKAAAAKEAIQSQKQLYENQETLETVKIQFPLSRFCTFRLVCTQCLLPLTKFQDFYWWNPGITHTCAENILAVQPMKTNYWTKIRERINHREFYGNYVLCRHYSTGKPQACHRQEHCMFAHSAEEQYLWTMEKDGQFHIAEFIRQNRSQNAMPLFSVAGVLEKYPGEIRHICGACFRQLHMICVQHVADASKCNAGYHLWQENKILIHYSLEGVVTEIGKRVFTSKTAYFKFCHHQKFCRMKSLGKCLYAHSAVERDLWCLERDNDMTEDQIVEEAMKIISQKYSGSPGPTKQESPEPKEKPAKGPSQPNVHQSSPVRPSEKHVSSDATSPPKSPYRVIEACKLCFQKGAISGCKKDVKDRCDGPGTGHGWDQNKMCLILPSKKKLSPLPKVIPRNNNFALCRHMLQKRKCELGHGGQCQFAHSKEEIEIWTWMVNNRVRALDDLVIACKKAYETPAAVAKPILKGQSVIAVSRAATVGASPLDLVLNAHYCHYCSIHCNSQKQWDEHCASEKHMFNVNSDKEHQWNFRQPPWGIGGCNYELCERHVDGGKCRFSEVPDMYNQCKFAHSQGELDEWKERWEWRQMKREIAKQEHLYSYMDELREDYETADLGVTVICEEIDGVTVNCSKSLLIFEEKKNATHSWVFEILSGSHQLHKVALLYDQDRLHFTLHGGDIEKGCQIAPGESFLVSSATDSSCYRVEVKFNCGIFGSFSQLIIFDFGERPVLGKRVNVELGNQFVQEKVKTLREKLKFDRWTSDNREIVWFDDNRRIASDMNSEILQSYKAPSSADAVVTQQTIGTDLNRHNYPHKMHKLLLIEELTQARIIARLNLQVEVSVMERIVSDSGLVNARSGELFVKVPLTDQLNEDTDAGHLILSGSATVLLAPMDMSDRIVYEAVFVQKENFDYNGRGREHFYLCLSTRCCEALNVSNGDTFEMEIQFQLNRLTFCQMHYAIDQLQNTDTVFPDISGIGQPCNESVQYHLSSDVLNEDQMKIIQYIVAQREGYSAPLVIYGPFGTGKTETLAQAAMILSANDSATRILICTHSNSAADLYILRHFDAFIKQSSPTLKVLRVYAKERRTNTVNHAVQKYCLMSDNRSCFLEPTRKDVLASQIVITTLVTSLVLTKKELNLRGSFTHIFIDEAAQVLECETIMPLSLAVEATNIVLAGDYNQMSQKVYSKEAQRQRFHRSLVHRLFDHYKQYAYAAKGALPNVLLRSNYRTKMEILRFLAAVFYGGPDKLIACSTQRSVDGVVPLTFYTAFGREVQDSDSTSYYNLAEIEEVVERVSELYNNWPKDWDDPVAESILVVTPYLDQVQKIRMALKKKNRELGRVSVDRVSNVQGTEFRAVFITTVRTQHLAKEPPNMLMNASECDGEFGDFGFLSDSRLLNTAFTRARSFVAVVGDPVALCAIGECMTIWRTYLKHCQNLKSIHPSTVTLDTVRTQVQNLLNSPVSGTNLLKLSALHQDAVAGKLKPEAEDKLSGEVESEFGNLKPDPNPFESLTIKGVFEDWSLDYHIEPDSIIQHLAEESILVNDALGFTKKPADALKLSCVRVQERKGHATVQYVPPGSNEAKKPRQLRRADDSNTEYDSDVDGSSEDEIDVADSTVYVDYMPQQLKELLLRQPERFKHCILKIENSRNMYARLLNCSSPCKQIRISSRLRCGRAFDSDEVVVEILPIDQEDVAALPDDQKDAPQGQVIGILRRAINPKYRMFVCLVDEENSGLMVPINRSIPKIYNLEPSQRAKKGHVCVYTFTRDKEPVFHHHEPIDPLNPSAKLFIVRYLKWEAKFYAPLGIVVGVLPAGMTIDQAMAILDVEYYIPKKFKDDTLNEVNQSFPASFKIPPKEMSNRLDYRDKLTFTIDPVDSTDLDDAISIEDHGNGCFLIGVHIADVSYFVSKGGNVDAEAESRGITYYPFACDPVPMLPDRLSSDLCSLLPGKDRLTVSVLFLIDAKANVQKVQIRRSVICSKYQLDYSQVEAIIKHRPMELEIPENLQFNTLMLNRVAQIWRKRRLGTASVYYGMDRAAAPESPEAHMMIEELMITANHYVAMHLIEKFPETTPLCSQLQPDALELEEWRQMYIEEAKNTVALTQPFKYRGEVCHCVEGCGCIPMTSDDSVMVDIRKSTWQEIRDVACGEDDDTDRLTSLIVSPENHPKTTLALLSLHRINNRAQYVSSGDVPHDEQNHYSLNISFYVHFTSPIRRYMDIVVHRLLKSCLDDQPSTYSQAQITELCNHCTEVRLKARCYEKAVETLHYAKLFREKPSALFPVVESLSDEVRLRFPLLKVLLPHRTRVTFGCLSLSDVPVIDEENQLKCKWSKRIYDLNPDTNMTKQMLWKGLDATVVLDGNKYVLQTTASDWRELLWSVISTDKDRILMSVMQVDELLVDSSQDERFAVDVTSEGAIVSSGHHFCDFFQNLRVGSVVQVQVASELFKGLLIPSIQLFNLTPTLNICVEHRASAVRCFTGSVMLNVGKKSYRSVEAYQSAWLPALSMEATYSAILGNDSVVVHNINISWEKTPSSSSAEFFGRFDIPVRFCKERQIRFKAELECDDDELNTNSSQFQRCHGYVCVQHRNAMTETPTSELPTDKLTSLSLLPTTWVGHCVASKICLTPDKKHYTIELRLHQSSCPLPPEIVKKSTAQQPTLATIEWIQKPLPYCRMEDALCELKTASQLAVDIALGKNPQKLDDSYLSFMDQWKTIEFPVFPSPNSVQTEAVNRAVHSPFTLIQGPPGTGKTVVGVQLAFLFAEINRGLPSSYNTGSVRPQVLCCGPSNKSVDVIARYLLQLKTQCPKLVRIYSESSEREEFPHPQDVLLKRKRFNAEPVPDDLKSISLHHLIRKRGANSSFIVEMDERIRSSPTSVEFQDVKSFVQTISRLETEVLQEAEIILCTCSTSGASRVRNGTNALQLILDESGMCLEPETLIPIVNSKAKQVVLLGDHMQLQPIVVESTARNRGLNQSLFERYADKAVTLTTQYRMHEAIAEFPSKYFYKGRLQVGRDEQTKASLLKFWPNGRNKPMAFVHVMGIEQALSVATSNGSEQSKSNTREVDVAVRAASLLVRRFHALPKTVAVLSQYRAQCSEIEKELLKRGEKDITVSTVVAAQGSEWDYVVLSTVRSLPKSSIEKKPTKGWKHRHLGFITDAHQINVALTRAKKGLIIIGNKYLLQCDEMWKKLLRHYDAEKKVIDAAEFMA